MRLEGKLEERFSCRCFTLCPTVLPFGSDKFYQRHIFSSVAHQFGAIHNENITGNPKHRRTHRQPSTVCESLLMCILRHLLYILDCWSVLRQLVKAALELILQVPAKFWVSTLVTFVTWYIMLVVTSRFVRLSAKGAQHILHPPPLIVFQGRRLLRWRRHSICRSGRSSRVWWDETFENFEPCKCETLSRKQSSADI